MSKPSHRITESGGKVTIHGLELFMAYDPTIDNAGSDGEIESFDNQRVKQIVSSTMNFIARGSYPQLVVMHDKDGTEPKSAVGRFTSISYEDRKGVGYIIGDCEVPQKVFDAMIRNNAFPRRSAEIYKDLNHLAAVALLGREAPRRPLPDTNFAHSADASMFSRNFNANFAGVGGGTNTFVPADTKETKMADPMDMTKMLEQMRCDLDEIKNMCNSHFGMTVKPTKTEVGETLVENGDEEMMEDEDEPTSMGDLEIRHKEEEDMPVAASRRSRSRHSRDSIEEKTTILANENARLKSKFARFERELRVERFARAIAEMQQDGYQIGEDQVSGLVAQLERSDDAAGLIDSWRELFSQNPLGRRIDMSRAAMPRGDISMTDVSSLVREHAGKPEAFAAAVNARLGTRR